MVVPWVMVYVVAKSSLADPLGQQRTLPLGCTIGHPDHPGWRDDWHIQEGTHEVGEVVAGRVLAQPVIATGKHSYKQIEFQTPVVLSCEQPKRTILSRSLKTCRFPFFCCCAFPDNCVACAGLISDFETLNSDLGHILRVTIVN